MIVVVEAVVNVVVSFSLCSSTLTGGGGGGGGGAVADGTDNFAELVHPYDLLKVDIRMRTCRLLDGDAVVVGAIPLLEHC